MPFVIYLDFVTSYYRHGFLFVVSVYLHRSLCITGIGFTSASPVSLDELAGCGLGCAAALCRLAIGLGFGALLVSDTGPSVQLRVAAGAGKAALAAGMADGGPPDLAWLGMADSPEQHRVHMRLSTRGADKGNRQGSRSHEQETNEKPTARWAWPCANFGGERSGILLAPPCQNVPYVWVPIRHARWALITC